MGAKRLGYGGGGETTRVENRGETTRGETSRGRNVLLPGGWGLKAFHCTNFTLGPDIILNTKNK